MKVNDPLLILLLALSVLSSCGWVKGKITFPSNSSSPLVLSATLAFTTNPVASNTDAIFSTQPVITSYDQFGNILTNDSTSTITLSAYDGVNCSGNIVAASLAGTTAVNLSSGIATYTDVRLLKTSIRSLKATSGAIATCSSSVSVSAGAASQISISSGDAQTGAVNTAISPFIVLVTDDNLNTVSNATINWSVTSGTGSLSSATSLSNSSGLASSTLTLGTSTGARTVSATIQGTASSVVFNATATPGLPATITKTAGDAQTATAGSPLPIDLTVLVRDAFNNPLPNITIDWAIVSGGGSVTATSVTNASGIAVMTHTLGNSAGANSVSATVNGQSMLNQVFTSTGVAGVATQIAIVSGNNQSVNLGSAFGAALVVRARDALNNVVENVTIDWTISSGSLTASSGLTLANGTLSNTATAVTTAGAQTVTATLNGLATNVSFDFTAVIAPPSSLAGNDGDASSSLTWTAPTGGQSYKIYTSAVSGSGYTLMGTSGTNSYSASLNNGQTYYIVVTAMNGVIESQYSNEIVVTPAPPAFSAWIKQLGDVTMANYYNGILNSVYEDQCKSVTMDSAGNSYCAGFTEGSIGEQNPRPGAGSYDAFMMKMNSSGQIQWITQLGRYTSVSGGDNSGSDFCNGIALDDQGNVYCAGTTDGALGEANGGGLDAFILKLNGNGVLQWITQLGANTQLSPGFNSSDDVCTSVSVVDEWPGAIFIDFSDIKIVCSGHTRGDLGETNAGSSDAFVMKVDYNGVLQWVTQLRASTFVAGGSAANNSGDDLCLGVTADEDGSIYCAGKTDGNLGEANGGRWDAFIWKLNSSGQSVWLTQPGASTKPPGGGTTSGENVCTSVSHDLGSAVYCGGYTEGNYGEASGGGFDAFIMKLNPTTGAIDWVKQLGLVTKPYAGSSATGDESCDAISANTGVVYCAGATRSSLGEAKASGYDAFVMQMRSNGQLNWLTQFGQTTQASGGNNLGDDYCLGVSFSAFGTVTCAGHTNQHFADTNGGSSDAFVVQLNTTSGALIWANQLGANFQSMGLLTRSAGSDQCKSVATDAAGNVYCAGSTESSLGETLGGAGDAFVMKSDADGNIVWITQLGAVTKIGPGYNSGADQCFGVAVDSSGNVYCGGSTSGNLGENNGGLGDAFVLKLDRGGNLLWVKQLGAVTKLPGGYNMGDDICNGIALDSQSNVYCAGKTSQKIGEANAGGDDAFVFKFDSDGNFIWVKQLGAFTNIASLGMNPNNTGNDVCNGLAIDSFDNIFCGGKTDGKVGEDNGGGEDAFILKLDPAGNLLWVKQFGAVTKVSVGYNSGDDVCYGVATDASGDVYCAGYTSGNLGESNGGNDDAFVLKLDSGSNLLWVKQLGAVTKISAGHNTGADRCNGVAVDSSNNVYCAGATSDSLGESSGGSYDAFMWKLNSITGAMTWLTQFGSVTMETGGDNTSTDRCYSVAVDILGNVICAGLTTSSMADGNTASSRDALIIKINSSGDLH